MERLSAKSAMLKGAQVKMRCLTAGKTTNWRWNIRTLLFKEPDLRSDSEIETLESFLSDNRFLSQYIENGKLKSLCRAIRCHSYSHGYEVYKEGSIGDCFYIIFDGKAKLISSKTSHVTELLPGDSFGEYALLYGQPRTNTAITSEDCELIELERDAFEKIIKSVIFDPIDIVPFLKNTVLFRYTSPEILENIIKSMTLRDYMANTVLITQGENPPGIFIIYSGSIKIFRSISFRESATNKTNSMIKDPEEGDKSEIKDVTIAELGQGESVGDGGIYNNHKARFFAVTSMPSLVFVISKSDISCDILYNINIKSLETPDDENLRENYFQKQKWHIYKNKLIKTVKTEMTLSKSKWKNSLRSVTPQPVERILNLEKIHLPPIRLSSKSKSKTPVKQKIKYLLTDR